MKSLFNYLLKFLRNLAVGDYRSKKLSNLIVEKIISYNKKKKTIRILDYGSGYQPRLIFFVENKLREKYKKKLVIDCYDYYKKKEIKELNEYYNNRINFHHVNSLKKYKKRYDFSLLCDVIHHIGIHKEKLIINLINNLTKKTKIVFIKDHFQTGKISNTIIRTMDFLGNYFNNVDIPMLYFSKKSFNSLMKKTNSKTIFELDSIQLYPIYLLFMSNPKFNFVRLVKKFRKK